MAGRARTFNDELCITCRIRPRRRRLRRSVGKVVTDSYCHACGLERRRLAKGAMAPQSKFSWQGLRGRPGRGARKKVYVTAEMLRG